MRLMGWKLLEVSSEFKQSMWNSLGTKDDSTFIISHEVGIIVD